MKTLKEMSIEVGKMDRLLVLAEELGIEAEEGQTEHDLAEAMMAAINGKDDTEWTAMSADLKEWSNGINSAKKLYVEKQKKSTPKAPAKAKAPAAEKAEQKSTPKAPAAGKKSTPKAPAKAKGKTKPKVAEAPAPEAEVEAEEPKTLAELKARAKAKVEAAGGGKKKQVVSDKAYTPNTTAWHVTQVVRDAGKEGVTMADLVKGFEARIKKFKLNTVNAVGRVRIIIGQCVRVKGLAEKKGDRFVATKKLVQSE